MLHFYFLVSVHCDNNNGIFKSIFFDEDVIVEASGSSRQNINGSMKLTKPEYSIIPDDKRYDWCSNAQNSSDDHPWISYSLKNKKFKLSNTQK